MLFVCRRQSKIAWLSHVGRRFPSCLWRRRSRECVYVHVTHTHWQLLHARQKQAHIDNTVCDTLQLNKQKHTHTHVIRNEMPTTHYGRRRFLGSLRRRSWICCFKSRHFCCCCCRRRKEGIEGENSISLSAVWLVQMLIAGDKKVRTPFG